MPGSYTTRKGYTIEVQSFPHMLPAKVQVAAEKKAAKDWPANPPTYDEELMGGGHQTFQHDEKSLVTDEDKAAWELYKTNQKKQVSYINEKMMQFYILTGTKVNLPEDLRWAKLQTFLGIELPEDEMELLYHYITTELLGGVDELVELINVIMEESGIDRDTMDAARASFRSVLGKAKDTNRRADGDSEGEQSISEVADIIEVSGDGGNGKVEAVAIPMGYLDG